MDANARQDRPSRLYAAYVLIVLVGVYVLNFVDRQILSILAEEIKRDLHLRDADLGFLFGTAFAVFYAVLGIPLGRLADVWNRRTLIACGLAVWSLMTAASGLARGFFALAVCRFGVGAGEASASPAAYSMLYDYFPPRVRTTVLSIYSTGVFIGQGVGIFIGGVLLGWWSKLYPNPADAPLGLKGWQAAFFAVGLPGLLMALLVATLREPRRGQSDGVLTPDHPAPLREAMTVLASVLPVASLFVLRRAGAGRRVLALNALAGLVVAGCAAGLAVLTRNVQQWAALGVAVYAIICWAQALSFRDPTTFAMVLKARTLTWTVAGVAASNFMLSAFGFWTIPFYQRAHGMTAAEIGPIMGLATGGMGFCGVLLGGFLADGLRRRFAGGKLATVLISLILSMLSALVLLLAADVRMALVGSFALMLTSSMGLGPSVSTLNDLVLPRMRATSSAFGFMVTYLVAGAIGPYLIGALSDLFVAQGGLAGPALREAMLWSLIVPATGVGLVLAAMKTIGADEAQMLERARALGEPL